MRLLYALQGTGNGHIARANVLVPLLRRHAEVDVFISGQNTQLALDFEVERSSGLSLFYSSNGGLNYRKIIQKNSFAQFVKSVSTFHVQGYDLIVNDYEPVTAYASRVRGQKILGLSHQAAVLHDMAPKPAGKYRIGRMIMRNYAPVENAIGFHFKKYDHRIFHPILRSAIKNLETYDGNFFVVYLPGFLDENLFTVLNQIREVNWIVFSPFARNPWRSSNCTFLPIDALRFLEHLAGARGVLCGAGFEFPAEVLHLKKMLYVIPIKGQFEQFCNYLALKELGATGSENLDVGKLRAWLQEGEILDVDFQDDTDLVISEIFRIAEGGETHSRIQD